MCFHFCKTSTGLELKYRYKTEDAIVSDPSWHVNGFEFSKVPVLIEKSGQRVWKEMNWGLIPRWVKNRSKANEIRQKTLNARCETVFELASYKQSIKKRRGIIPVNGFFEWQKVGKDKHPYFISMKEGATTIFSLAAVYDVWVDEEGEEEVFSFSVLTCRANTLMEQIHNTQKRMPVILGVENESKWINEELDDKMSKELMVPFDSEKMTAYPIHPQFMRLKGPETIREFKHNGGSNQLSIF